MFIFSSTTVIHQVSLQDYFIELRKKSNNIVRTIVGFAIQTKLTIANRGRREHNMWLVHLLTIAIVSFPSVWLENCVTPCETEERRQVIEVITTSLKGSLCRTMVVAFDSLTESTDIAADHLLLDTLMAEYYYPIILIENSTKPTTSLKEMAPINHLPVCTNAVILGTRASDLSSLYFQLKDRYFVHTAFLVLKRGKPDEIETVLKQIKDENVIGMLENPEKTIQIRSWRVGNIIKDTTLSSIRKMNQSGNANPKRSIKGRHLKIAAIDQPPTVIVKSVSKNNLSNSSSLPIVQLTGIEPAIVENLAEKLGFTYEYILASPKELWGEVVQREGGDLYATGMVGLLMRKEADVAIGNFYVSIRRTPYITYSTVHKIVQESFLIPAPKPYPKWMAPLLPFDLTIWIAISSASISIIIALRSFTVRWMSAFSSRIDKHFSELSFCALYIVGHFSSIQMEPQNIRLTASRVCLFWWLAGVVVLSTLYRSLLTSYISFPISPPPIQSVRQLLDSPLKMALRSNFTPTLLKSSTDPLYQRLGQQLVVETNATKFFALMDTGLWALESDVDHLLYHAVTLFPVSGSQGPRVHLMKQTMLPNAVALGFQKNSPLKPYFDKQIMLLVEAGLVNFHRSKFAKIPTNWSPKKSSDSNLTSFSLGSLQGPFFFYLTGIIASVIVFLFEIIRHR